MKTFLALLPYALGRIRKPFGPDDEGGEGDTGDADHGGSEDSRRSGEQGESGGDDAPLTAKQFREILDQRLSPLEKAAERDRNRRHAERRRSGSKGSDDGGGGDGDGKGGTGKEKTTRELADEARDRRLKRLEEADQKRQIDEALSREIGRHSEKLVDGADAKIRKILAGSLVVDEGEVFSKQGGQLLDLSEAVELEAKDPMFLRGSKRAASDSRGGDPKKGSSSDRSGGGEDGDYYDVDFDTMTDEELAAFEKKEAARQKKEWERRQSRR